MTEAELDDGVAKNLMLRYERDGEWYEAVGITAIVNVLRDNLEFKLWLQSLIKDSQVEVLGRVELPEVLEVSITGKRLPFSRGEEYQQGYFAGKRRYKYQATKAIQDEIERLSK